MKRLFGTDGIRARFGEAPLLEGSVVRLGRALATLLGGAQEAPVLIARDTRASGSILTKWLAEGMVSGGIAVVDLGILPTAALARWVAKTQAAAGVMVSASHNPPQDNGIKLFDERGRKWSPEREAALEELYTLDRLPPLSNTGSRYSELQSGDQYLADLLAIFPNQPLTGMRIALDCANGAASELAPTFFKRLGASVHTLGATPDGANINVGYGSMHPEVLSSTLQNGAYDLGFAFDGDADRALLFGPKGTLHDGDAMLYLWAQDLARSGALTPKIVVSTVLANQGLELALNRLGIGLLRSSVGDREVARLLEEAKLRLGGEPSGHLLDLQLSTTGDGLLTAAQLATLIARAGQTPESLLSDFERFPQRQIQFRVQEKPPLESLPNYHGRLERARDRLRADGRVVIRYSGTEPLIRIFVEGKDATTVNEVAEELANFLKETLA